MSRRDAPSGFRTMPIVGSALARIFHPVSAGLYLVLLLNLVAATDAAAVLKTSVGHGSWNTIAWSPAGVPSTGDNIVIATNVTDMPSGSYGSIYILTTAALTLSPVTTQVASLTVNGILTLPNSSVLKVSGDVVNNGIVRENGSIEITANRVRVAGPRAFTNLVLNAGPGSVVNANDQLILGSLYIANGTLNIGAFPLLVKGPFYSNTPLGSPGIVATTGTVTLNGEVYGSVRAKNIVLGIPDGVGVPVVYGTLGDSGATVRVSASRQFAFSTITGTVTVDSGVTVGVSGIGPSGMNTIRGSLLNRGRLVADDVQYRWRVEGDVSNTGTIDNCTVMMTGRSAVLQTSAGSWGHDASLSYVSGSGGRLQLQGSITLPRMEIAALLPTDSDIVVQAGLNELLIRHNFTSDRGRRCKLTSDSIVRLRSTSDGIISGNVSFEGFWDSDLGGDYGGSGKTVWFRMPKRIVSPMQITGVFAQQPNARLNVLSTMSLPSSSELTADFTVASTGTIIARGDLITDRTGRGGGAIEMLGAAALLNVRGQLVDSLILAVGRDTLSSHVTLSRTLSVPRMIVSTGSTIAYNPGDSVNVSTELRYRLQTGSGFAIMSLAAEPPNHAASQAFPGITSYIFRFDNVLGYIIVDSVVAGNGYWVSYPTPRIIEQRGRFINAPLTVPVHTGWNMIGGASIPITVSRITVSGTTRLSDFYDLTSGYTTATVLMPGKGYWVQFAGEGVVTLNP